ncbi:malectin domain-containing carbohydrate-binding protein [Myxosarcina sp. GI1]|uniref:malectin domain-containing carbohydrate-binding protein n=1 Tax=Myxosarcina sp. GI1 TaxID=1541065 RepID=UPI00068F9CCD|nr:malectin domain-containing carbohydrate-binding protein [Myxosarcina sp. GI1]
MAITQLTSNGVSETPDVNKDRIVWIKNGSEIILYDGTSNTKLSNTGNNLITDLQISETGILWNGYTNGWQIFFYDNNNINQLTNDPYIFDEKLSGNKIAWRSAPEYSSTGSLYEVYVYDNSTQATTQLTNNNIGETFIDISGQNVVWQGSGNTIFLNDGTNTTQLSTNGVNPHVSEDLVAWEAYSGGTKSEIYLYDSGNTTQIVDSVNNVSIQGFFDGNLVWGEWVGNDWELFRFDGTNTYQITNNDINDTLNPSSTVNSYSANSSAAVDGSGNNLVWSSYVDDNWEIFYYDGSETIRVTNNDIDDLNPKISGNTVVWNTSGATSDVFMFEPELSSTGNITGSDGDDRLFATDNSYIDGGAGFDTLVVDYTDRRERLDVIANFGYLDIFFPESGNSSRIDFDNIESFEITGGRSNDNLDLGIDNFSDDTVNGGAGNDLFRTGRGIDSVDGGVGTDKLSLDFSNSNSSVTSNLTDSTSGEYSDGENSVSFSNIETVEVFGSNYSDVLVAPDAGMTNNNLEPIFATSYIDGGEGFDTLVADYSERRQRFDLVLNYNSLVLYSSEFYFSETSSNNRLIDFNNIESFEITGGRSDDTFDLGADNFSNDTVNGGAGDDYFIDLGQGRDSVDGGAGIDRLRLDYSDSFNSIISTISNSISGEYSDGENSVSFSNIEILEVTGSSYDDVLVATNAGTTNNYYDPLTASYYPPASYINGGDGVDTVKFSQSLAEAGEISTDDGFINIGTEYTLFDVEFIEFSDARLEVAPTISLADYETSISEGNIDSTFVTFDFNLSNPTIQDVTIDVFAYSDSADAGIDYLQPSQLIIEAGKSSGTLALEILGDTVAEADEAISLDFTLDSGGTFADGNLLETAVVNVLDNDIIYTTDEDVTLTITAAELLGNNTEGWSIDSIGNSVNGTAIVNNEGNVEFTPAANLSGTASFDYIATNGAENTTASIEVTVAPVNDAPVLNNSITDQIATENALFSFTIPGDTFIDVDAEDSLTYTATLADGSNLPTWISFDASSHTLSGTPLNEDSGNISIKVTASDGEAETSDTFDISISDANDVVMEYGKVENLTDQLQTINLTNSFTNPVVFIQPLSNNESDPAIVRLQNITDNSFDLRVQEANYLDGLHTAEAVSYFVLEAGTWQLDDGTLLEVGTTDSEGLVAKGAGFDRVDFNSDFAATPVVLSQIQTENGLDFVRTRQRNSTVDGFEIAMEEEEANQNTAHVSETVGWLAMETGSGQWGDFSYYADRTGDIVTHDWSSIEFDGLLTQEPQLAASVSTYDGADASGLRYNNLSTAGVDIKVEEDRSLDNEVIHTTEIVDFLMVEGSGSLSATPVDFSSTNETSANTIFVNAAGDDYTDSLNRQWSNNYSGFTWSDNFTGLYSSPWEIEKTEEDELYQTGYYGSDFSYNTALDNGVYDVTLKFADLFFDAAGERVFDVSAEEQLVLDDLDVFSEAGGQNIALDKSFTVEVTDGALDLNFTASVNNAMVAAIAIEPSIGV